LRSTFLVGRLLSSICLSVPFSTNAARVTRVMHDRYGTAEASGSELQEIPSRPGGGGCEVRGQWGTGASRCDYPFPTLYSKTK